MPDQTKTRRSHTRLWIEAGIRVVLLALAAAGVWYLRSPQFEDFVRQKVIATIEDATGGRVDLQSFHWNLSKLEFEANNLTIRGREGPEQLPYMHADRAYVRLHIISFLETRAHLRYLGLEHPVVHLIVYRDGSTNAPEPKVKRGSVNPVQQLFDLAIGRADLHNGILLLNDQELPLDFSADDIGASMSYDHRDRRFDGTLQVGKIDAKYKEFRDVAAQAQAAFSLWHDTVQFKSLKLMSEGSSLEAQGKLTNFDNPRIEFTYNTTLNLAQLGAVTRSYTFRGGMLTSSGTGKYSETSRTSRGKVAIRGLDYLQEGVVLRDANASADFALDNDHLSLTRIAGHLLGGEVTGEVTVDNLLASSSATSPPLKSSRTRNSGSANSANAASLDETTAKIKGPDPQHGTARFHVSGVSMAQLARAISTKSLPVDELKLAGRVGGAVDLSWTRSLADAQGELALDIVPPPQIEHAEIVVSGSLHSHYMLHPQVLDIANLNLMTPHTHVTASGTLGTTADLKIVFVATSLKEFEPFVLALGYAPSPVELAGEARFNGTINGRLEDSLVGGHVEASNFTYTFTPLAKPAEHPAHPPSKRESFFHISSPPPPAPSHPVVQVKRIHIDHFSADVRYCPSKVALHNAVIQEGSAHFNVDWTAALVKGSFTEDSLFQLQAAMHNADFTDLQHAAGLNYPVTGTLNATLQAAGTEGNPHGQGQFTLSAAQAYGRPVKSASADLAFANHGAQFNHIRLLAARGVVAGSATYNFNNKGITFDLNGAGIDLAEVPELQSARLQTGGSASFAAKGSGTFDEPFINGYVQLSDLVLNGERIGGFTVKAATRGMQLQLTARSNFPKGSLSLDGNVELGGDMPGNMTLQFSNVDIDPFLRGEIKGRITGHSSMVGQATLAGPLKRPKLLNGDFKINEFKVEVQKVPIASDGPVEFHLANGVVAVQRCVLISEESRLALSGNVGLETDHRLDLRADGNVNLKLVHTLDPDVSSYGNATVGVTVTGDTAKPLMNGRIEIIHGGLSMIDLPTGLGDINGSFKFNLDKLEVEHLTARTGGGLVTFGGFVTYGRTPSVDLTATGNEIRFRYAGISVTSDQSLRLMGTLQNASLKGDVTVTRFAQIPSTDLPYALAQASPAAVPNPKSPLNALHLDVRILSAPELTVQTSLAKLSGGVDLRLRGTAARPVLLGRINIAEGDLKIGGTKYHLERGDITFTDPVRIDPVLDVEATTRVRDYDITIGLHGTLERLTTTYRSDPPLSSDDIVALLAFGRTQGDTTSGATAQLGFAESATNAVLGQAINQTVSSRASKLFGVSSIRINPSVEGTENNPNARLTVEQQVSNNVTLTYITNLTRSAQQVIQLEYNINSEYTFQAIRDENGVVSFDLLVRKRKR